MGLAYVRGVGDCYKIQPKCFFENRRTACSPISISIHININDYLINLVLLCTYFFSHVKVDFREQPVRQFS